VVKLCKLDGCDRVSHARHLCGLHYRAERRHGTLHEHALSPKVVPPDHISRGWVTKRGYIRIQLADGSRVYQHRYVMEQHLGRRLLRTENVHHVDGNRANNNLENLELWVTSQPSGQRPRDLVKWAREILERYGDTA
jgi:hypothetical protein